jgi:hypothetical protein
MWQRDRVDADSRLVHDDDLRLVQQGGTNVDAAFHAAGKFADAILLAFAQTDDLQHFRNTLVEGCTA